MLSLWFQYFAVTYIIAAGTGTVNQWRVIDLCGAISFLMRLPRICFFSTLYRFPFFSSLWTWRLYVEYVLWVLKYFRLVPKLKMKQFLGRRHTKTQVWVCVGPTGCFCFGFGPDLQKDTLQTALFMLSLACEFLQNEMLFFRVGWNFQKSLDIKQSVE